MGTDLGRLPSESGTPEPRFVADAMLARLARWLRVLGFDTVLDPARDDRDLVDLAEEENRVLLTRDRHIIAHLRPRRFVHVLADAPLAQLREVAESTALALPRDLFTRCLLCNAKLRAATAAEVEELVPQRSRTLEGPFTRCPHCGRVYWPGAHVRRMRAALSHAFPHQFP